MEKKVIGIIGAMGLEVEVLKEKVAGRREEVIAGRTFYIGKIGSSEVVLVCSGIGKVNAAVTTQLLIDRFQVGLVINTGIAGGALPQIHVRDMVVSVSCAYHDMDPRILSLSYPNIAEFKADEALLGKVKEACRSMGITCYEGKIATGDQFIDSKAVKDDIIRRLSPACVEMEGGAVAHTCTMNNVPFSIIRCISDNADDSAQMDYETFEKLAADDAAAVVEAVLA